MFSRRAFVAMVVSHSLTTAVIASDGALKALIVDGRVFQNALGHLPAQLRSVAFIATFQRRCEWVATGKVTQAMPADVPGPDKPSVRK